MRNSELNDNLLEARTTLLNTQAVPSHCEHYLHANENEMYLLNCAL